MHDMDAKHTIANGKDQWTVEQMVGFLMGLHRKAKEAQPPIVDGPLTDEMLSHLPNFHFIQTAILGNQRKSVPGSRFNVLHWEKIKFKS